MKSKIIFSFAVIFSISLLTTNRASSQMVWNQACQFNGTANSYIAIPHSASLNITADFGLEAWINPVNSTSPATQIIMQKRDGFSSSGYTLYLDNGKAAIRSNQSKILAGKTVIPNNQWTHICGTYDIDNDKFVIYVNGVEDTSRNVDIPPVSNTDSVFIGKGNGSPFNGKMDEVRIWNSGIGPDVSRKISLSTSSGYGNTGTYSALQLSLTFQNLNPSGTLFSLNDFSGRNNNAYDRGVTSVNLSNMPSEMISLNECIRTGGANGYISGPDHPIVSPVSGITLEVWIYPLTFSSNQSILSSIIHKGNASGSVTDYGMKVNLQHFQFYINETLIANLTSAEEIFPLRKWTHAAFSFSAADGFAQFIRNGKIEWDDTNFVGNIHDNIDSLYVGGTPLIQRFEGYIDEVRISSTPLPYGTISNQMFTSINESNDQITTNVVYNFDGSLTSNSDAGSILNFRSFPSGFSNNAWAGDLGPVSPLTNSLSTNFPSGYYLQNTNHRIPNSGTSGFMNSDTLYVPLSETISDVNVYAGINHSDEDNLVVTLISPSGILTVLYNTNSLMSPSDHLVTIFDDQADSSLSSNRYVLFAPSIKPLNNLNSALSGSNSRGKWMLRIQDVAASDTGILIGWGIQFNNQVKRESILSIEALVQGFYNSASNLMIQDTMRVYLRNSMTPFNVLDSSEAILADSGNANFIFNNIQDGVPVYIQLKHRNSLETWSKIPTVSGFAIYSGIYFSPGTSHLNYKFSDAQSSTFGNNSIHVDSLPVRFALFNGDVNQDGTIDLSDVLQTYNDANAFASGYAVTDLTGDNAVDLTDVLLAYNNSAGFVSLIRP